MITETNQPEIANVTPTLDRFDPYRMVRRHRRLLWAGLKYLLPVAILLALSAAYVTYFSADLRFTLAMQRITNPVFKSLMVGVSWFGNNNNGLILTGLWSVILLLLGLKLEAGTLALGASLGEFVSSLIKIIIGRPRPSTNLVNVYIHANGNSFPSGHVFHYVAAYGFLFYLIYILAPRSFLRNTLLIILGLMIGLVGFSRIYLGDHWASDVTGGYLFGTVWLLLMIDFYWRMKVRSLKRKTSSRT
ncbi:MAG TPA: phosphatase PAP2 family protein [Blastocatellia bacterium]|nr:phosphatase PAP2 family protein [Blastocatellia bacterium]